jgi:hypothetical protein
MMVHAGAAFALVCLTTLAAACSTGGSPPVTSQGSPCAPDATLPVRCCGNVAQEVAAALSGGTCDGSVAYALCDGIVFECEPVCALPPGFTVVSSGAKESCPEDVAIADAPSANPVPFDGGGLHLGPCSGDVVALIEAATCPNHCPGSLAYAVCKGDAYGECACNIPPGYSLVGLSDGTAFDTGADAPGVPKEGGGG